MYGLILLYPQISFAAASISLSDSKLYPRFLRTIPADDMVPQGMIAVMKEFNWENFGIVTQQEDAFTSVSYNSVNIPYVRIYIDRSGINCMPHILYLT